MTDTFKMTSLHSLAACLQADTLAALTRLTHLKLTIHKDDLMGNMEEALAALTDLHSLHVTVASKLDDYNTEIVPLQVMIDTVLFPQSRMYVVHTIDSCAPAVCGLRPPLHQSITCLLLMTAGVLPDRAAAADQPQCDTQSHHSCIRHRTPCSHWSP
jgi:hypothetical protein